jgi:hypothetical protein
MEHSSRWTAPTAIRPSDIPALSAGPAILRNLQDDLRRQVHQAGDVGTLGRAQFSAATG